MDRCFIAGIAYWLGLRALGCAAIRAGASSTLADHRVDSSAAIPPASWEFRPSCASLRKKRASWLRFARQLRKTRDLHWRPVRDKTFALNNSGRAIEEIWGAKVFSTYGVNGTG